MHVSEIGPMIVLQHLYACLPVIGPIIVLQHLYACDILNYFSHVFGVIVRELITGLCCRGSEP